MEISSHKAIDLIFFRIPVTQHFHTGTIKTNTHKGKWRGGAEGGGGQRLDHQCFVKKKTGPF